MSSLFGCLRASATEGCVLVHCFKELCCRGNKIDGKADRQTDRQTKLCIVTFKQLTPVPDLKVQTMHIQELMNYVALISSWYIVTFH